MVFPQEARQADQLVAFVWDVTAEPDEVREGAGAEAAKLGVRALKLADDLREGFRLPKRDLKFGEFDVRECLAEALKDNSASEYGDD